jgi:hypothetical protein
MLSWLQFFDSKNKGGKNDCECHEGLEIVQPEPNKALGFIPLFSY